MHKARTRLGEFHELSYLCPHNVVCSAANPYFGTGYSSTLPSFYKELHYVFLDVLCPTCNSEAYTWKDVYDRLHQYIETYKGKAAEHYGYEIGDTITLKNDITK